MLWSRVSEITLAKGFSFNTQNMKYPCRCVQKKRKKKKRKKELPGMGVHKEKFREMGRIGAREEAVTDS